ncbi:MAG TPA: hypothetical protein VGK20_10665 [Candidatus Binatia bacterium]
MARAAAVSAPSGPWIVGRRYDQLFLWAAWCVPLALWAVAVSIPYGLLVALVVFVLLDNSHQVATLPLTIFDPSTMKTSAPVYLGGAAAIGATAIAIAMFPGTFAAQLWASLVIYWGAWHIIRQHYGFLRLYQARDKPSDANLARAEVYALYSGASFPYFMNLSHGWAAAEGIGKLLYAVPVPKWSPWVVLAIFALSFGYVLVDALRRAIAGKPAVTIRLVHVLLVVSNFWIGLLWAGRENIILAVLFITSYHDLQYHAVVWHVGRKRSTSASEPVRPAVKRIFGSLAIFTAAIVVGALLQAFLRNDFQLAGSLLPQSPVTGALFGLVTSYSYMHYYFDGKMWKLSRDARLRAELGLGSGGR